MLALDLFIIGSLLTGNERDSSKIEGRTCGGEGKAKGIGCVCGT